MISIAPPQSDNTTTTLFASAHIKDCSPNQQLLPLTATLSPHDTLEVGGCDVPQLVHQYGSPLYIVDETTLRMAAQQYRQAFATYYPGESQVLYASKAWSCLAICAIAAGEGLGVDVVSGGELYTALQAGVDPAQIYVHGNNKSPAELSFAIATGCVVVADNWLELQQLAQLATEMDPSTPPRVMLRITPGIECHTHDYIRTGHLDSKFGFDPGQLDQVLDFAQQHPEIHWLGFHAHIGSQIFELQPHRDLTEVMVSWLAQAHQRGLTSVETENFTSLNVGGGLGMRYVESDDPPTIDSWAQVIGEGITAACQHQNVPLPKLLCEPGRSLVGPACMTAYSVGAHKEIPGIRTYLSVDGGMSDNPRPITYQSEYRAVVANRMSTAATERVTVAGKHCESGDIVIKDIHLPPTQPNDILVTLGTGAYNYSMASNYNRLPRPAAVLVHNGEANLIVQRETYQDLVRQDRLPERLRSALS